MLHEFPTANRQILIARCREKVAKRFESAESEAAIDHGVPLFPEHLVATLRAEQKTNFREGVETNPTPAPTPIGRAAALHGAELLRRGYSIADAVASFGAGHVASMERQAESLQQRLAAYTAEQARLIDVAAKLLAAIKTGK
jgi:hypothetical protein